MHGVLRADEGEPHRPSLAKNAAAFFRISRSSLRTRFSLRRRASSSRSWLVSAPAGPRPWSTSACCTQLRSAESVRSRSRAISLTVLLLDHTSCTALALNSAVNRRRFRFCMDTPRVIVASRGVSTKPGQDQADAIAHRGDADLSAHVRLLARPVESVVERVEALGRVAHEGE